MQPLLMWKKVKSKALKWFSNFFEKLQLLLNDHTKLKPIFEILVNSEDEDILKKMGRFFSQKFWSKRSGSREIPCRCKQQCNDERVR